VLSIDCGWKNLGWALFSCEVERGQRPLLLSYGCEDLLDGRKTFLWSTVREGLLTFLRSIESRIGGAVHTVAIESQALGAIDNRRMLCLQQVIAMGAEAVLRAAEILTIRPSRVKTFFLSGTGEHGENKRVAVERVRSLYPDLEIKDHNACDAILQGLFVIYG
jgi:hypothetical protein